MRQYVRVLGKINKKGVVNVLRLATRTPPWGGVPPVKNPCIRRTGLKGTRFSSKVRYLQESFTNILSCNVFN